MPKETLTWEQFRSRYNSYHDIPTGVIVETDSGVLMVTVKEDGDTFFSTIDPMELLIEDVKEAEDG